MKDETPQTREALIQNLEDAGCSKVFIKTYLDASHGGGTSDRLRLLETRRRDLLQQLHAQQRQLDCLDYLRYQLQKSQAEEPQKR